MEEKHLRHLMSLFLLLCFQPTRFAIEGEQNTWPQNMPLPQVGDFELKAIETQQLQEKCWLFFNYLKAFRQGTRLRETAVTRDSFPPTDPPACRADLRAKHLVLSLSMNCSLPMEPRSLCHSSAQVPSHLSLGLIFLRGSCTCIIKLVFSS